MDPVGAFVWLAFLSAATTVSAGLFDKKNVLITSFKYKSCDPAAYSKNGVWIRELDVLTTMYGDLDVLGSFVTAVNLTAPIKASVSMRRNVLGIYFPMPCIRKFGSCDYPDLCVYGYAKDEKCPAVLDENDIPCRCPIEPGIYTLPGAQFPVSQTRWASILAGKYKGLVKFYSGNRLVSCYKFYYTLDSS